MILYFCPVSVNAPTLIDPAVIIFFHKVSVSHFYRYSLERWRREKTGRRRNNSSDDEVSSPGSPPKF